VSRLICRQHCGQIGPRAPGLCHASPRLADSIIACPALHILLEPD
jgi:hypothetical protein